MRLIDADALLETLNSLEAHGGSPTYRRALSDALHDFFPQIIANQPTIELGFDRADNISLISKRPT